MSNLPQLSGNQRAFNFNFEGHNVRPGIGDNGQPLIVAADVCGALDIADVSSAVARLDDDQKGTVSIRTPGGMQTMLAVNESGLYSLIFTSRKAQAKRFQKWVTGEVLPAIRRTGSYAVQMTPAEIILMQAQKLVDIEHEQKRQADSVRRIEARQDAVDEKQAYFTVFGYANYIGRHLDSGVASQLGKKATAYSKLQNVHIGKIKDAKYGHLQTYHEDILRDVFADWYSQPPLLDE